MSNRILVRNMTKVKDVELRLVRSDNGHVKPSYMKIKLSKTEQSGDRGRVSHIAADKSKDA